MLREKAKQFIKNSHISLKDYFSLIFRSSSKNQLRIQNCRQNPDGKIKCNIYFDSYVTLKSFQKKLRTVTYGLTATVISVVVATLITNFITGQKIQTYAATHYFIQQNWNTLDASDTADHTNNKTGWIKYTATTTQITASSSIMMTTIASSTTLTTDADFSEGTLSQVGTSSNSIKLNIASEAWGAAELIDSNLHGNGSVKIAVDSNSNAHVCYTRYITSFDLMYATNESGSWATSTIINNAVNCDIVVDSNDKVHISYKPTSGGVYISYATNESDSWVTSTLDSSVTINETSIAIDSNDKLHISYNHYEAGAGIVTNLRYITNESDSWVMTELTSDGVSGQYNGIAVDSNDKVHISYYDSGVADLKYITNESDSWVTTTIDSAGAVGRYSFIDVDSNNKAHVSYYYGSDYDTRYATNESDSWVTEDIETSGVSGDGTEIAIDSLDNVHLLYRKQNCCTWYNLEYANNSSGSWVKSNLDDYFNSSNTVEDEFDITFDIFDQIYTVYKYEISNKYYFRYKAYLITYFSQGTSTSATIDPGVPIASWGNLSWSNSNGQTITMKARTDADGDFSDATDWSSCTNIASGTSISLGGCSSDVHRYIQYQAVLSTADQQVTPSLDDVTIGYNIYATTTQSLTSSKYDSGSVLNSIGGISWTLASTTPAGTYMTMSLKASSSAVLLDTTDWAVFTATTTNCTDTNGLISCTSGNSAMPSWLTDGGTNQDDRWFQYKVTMSSTGSSSPKLDWVQVTYVVNDVPEVQNVTATQATSDGSVVINYETRDSDTDDSEAAYQGFVDASLQYSIDGGSNWLDIVDNLSAGATTTPKIVEQVNWTSYIATWTPKYAISPTYTTQFKIKVKVDDKEGANNIGSSTSDNTILDTIDPVPGAYPVIIQATTSPATLIMDATDNSLLYMRVGLTADLAGISFTSFASSTTLDLESNDPATVYYQFKDAYQSSTTIASVISIDTPTAMMIQDITNTQTTPNEPRLFIAWEVMDAPLKGFSAYKVYRSTDNSSFSVVNTIGAIGTNYYVSTSVTEDQLYYYKVAMEDTINNSSYFSTTIQAMPNGIQDFGEGGGGTPADPATISNISSSNLTTSGATITWTTDKLSNSTVGYSVSPATDYTNEQGVSSYVTTHSVVLTGLIAGTTYNYKVLSTDIYTNIASTTGNSFSTNSGPAIATTTVAILETTNSTAKIYWETDLSASGYAVYASSSPPSGNEAGSAALATSRTVELTGLTTGTKYYFYLKSQGSGGNWAYDYNTVSGVNQYYDFITASDTTAPTFSSISASLITDDEAVISWTTNESATGQVIYGITSGSLNTYSTLVSTFNINHSIGLDGLSNNTTYYYQVASVDAAANAATSTEQSFATLETLTEESAVATREATARSEGVASAPGGGGMLVIDKTDKIPPVISDIKVTDVKSSSATISWVTNEGADSFVEYGDSTSYGNIHGGYLDTTNHKVELKNLNNSVLYNFRVLGKDANGNLTISPNQTFTTLSEIEEIIEEEQIFEDIEALSDAQASEELLLNTVQKAMDIVAQVASQVSITTLESTLFSQYDSLQKLALTIPPPLLSGEPKVVVTATTAIVSWRTDKDSNSLVAIAREDDYEVSSGEEERYSQVIGNTEARTKTHLVNISSLEPETTYHYQVRSKSPIGPMGKSDDFTFTTKNRNLEISSYAITKVSTEEAIFKWVTNVEADSGLRYTPYRNNILAVDEARNKDDKAVTLIHEIGVDEFEAGVIYDIELYGKDIKGNETTRKIEAFSTSEDDLPPTMFQVQTDSAISPGSDTKVQTIISWMTNEPSTTRVYYQKGFTDNEELLEKTKLDINYTKKHVVVITKFEPGTVYRFRVESIDSGGNIALSKNYTILTPRQKETVLQIIMKNVEDVFGWVGEINN